MPSLVGSVQAHTPSTETFEQAAPNLSMNHGAYCCTNESRVLEITLPDRNHKGGDLEM